MPELLLIESFSLIRERVEESSDAKSFFIKPTTERAKKFLKTFDYE